MRNLIPAVLCLLSTSTLASEKKLETMVIEGRQVNLLGEAVSSSEGLVGQQEIELRPILRTGEILELVPGMVVTQHSGTGKANQYFLRGFNLDHGTDFATFVDGMPVNMRSHGHGQGYTDLNFLIPEAVSFINYQKGPYYADIGDFSSAGSAQIQTLSDLDEGRVEVGVGEDDYYRFLAMNSFQTGQGESLLAFEATQYHGPWVDINEDLERYNVLMKHTMPLQGGNFNLSFMAYNNQWNSADQIPERAVEQGLIDELGSIDKTTGGESSRYSLSAHWLKNRWDVSAYMVFYDLNLWSNFTYFLEDEDLGDQFEQVDQRVIYGGQASYQFNSSFFDYDVSHRFGGDLRIDDIDEVGLYQTQARQRLGTVRSDQIEIASLGLYWENQIAWTDQVRTVLGARYDYVDFEVDDLVGENTNGVNLQDNSGRGNDGLFSLKGSLVYSFHHNWETYASIGQGFHSNDVRGATAKIDPADGVDVEQVDPFVRSLGYEVGLRGFINDRLNTSISVWELNLDSELLFVGDAGNTEPNRESKRQGVELTAYYHFTDQWSLDLEYAASDSEFTEDTLSEGKSIPGAIEQVLQVGLNANFISGWRGSLRLRHFGERPLVEDGSVKSDSTTIWNLRTGYKRDQWTINADILNLTDSDDHDIDYFYESRLSTEPSGVGREDIHYHVIEPRTVRLSFGYRF